jgi:hypothetical protein
MIPNVPPAGSARMEMTTLLEDRGRRTIPLLEENSVSRKTGALVKPKALLLSTAAPML